MPFTAHAGAVNDATESGTDSPAVAYAYADGSSSGEAKYVRLATLGTEETLFFTYDKQFDVTAVIKPDQTVVERYSYKGYGDRTVHNADLTKKTVNASTVDQQRGHQGLPLDRESGAYYNRARQLLPGIGVFSSRDPEGQIDGPNLYQYLLGNPTRLVDARGESVAETVIIDAARTLHRFWKIAGRHYGFGQHPSRNSPNLSYGIGPSHYSYTAAVFIVDTCGFSEDCSGSVTFGQSAEKIKSIMDQGFSYLKSFVGFGANGSTHTVAKAR